MNDWHSWAAIVVFVGAYALIISEKIHRVAAALGGAGADAGHRRHRRQVGLPLRAQPASTGTSSSC